jgi:transposase-like protein
MLQPYSADLCERVLVAYEQGKGSQVAIARRFRVCPATVCNWIRQAGHEGHRGGPAGVLGLQSFRCYRRSWLRPTMPAWMSMLSACSGSPAGASAVR